MKISPITASFSLFIQICDTAWLEFKISKLNIAIILQLKTRQIIVDKSNFRSYLSLGNVQVRIVLKRRCIDRADKSKKNPNLLLFLAEFSIELVRTDAALHLGAHDERSSILAIVLTWTWNATMLISIIQNIYTIHIVMRGDAMA